MKNIYILPTYKPSRLCYDRDDTLLFAPNVGFTISDGKQHLYITSDEDIKEGDWLLEKEQIVNKFPTYLTDLSECKKIILTTDPKLIADGVQAIDDEFLEWFVKNPSCEYVKILNCPIEGLYTIDLREFIPQEEQEPKRGDVVQSLSDEKEVDGQFIKFLQQIEKEKEKIKSNLEGAKKYLIKLGFLTEDGKIAPEYQDEVLNDNETPEDASLRIYPISIAMLTPTYEYDTNALHRRAFIKGVEWKTEQINNIKNGKN